MKATCTICGNSSFYDRKTIKSDTYEINGVKVVICGNCAEGLLGILIGRFTFPPFSSWKDDIKKERLTKY